MGRQVKIEGVQKAWNKYKFVILVALIGAALLLWPSGEETADPGGTGMKGDGTAELQEELEEILSRIQGVGQVEVLLTAETDGTRQLAQNVEISYSGSSAAPEDYSRQSELVLADSGGGDETVVIQTCFPTYRGALVVCEGGDQAEVKLTVTEAVAALTGLTADRITVAKWQ